MRSTCMFILAVLAHMIAGCAQSPEEIRPSYASPVLFQKLSCNELAAESHRLHEAYKIAVADQDQAQFHDGVGLLLVGLPLASMSGQDVTEEIARIKGEHLTLDRVARELGCIS